jgi:hypothetical protein
MMVLQGRPSPPSVLQSVPLTVSFYPSTGGPPALVATPAADDDGRFTVANAPAGTYHVRVKHAQSLSSQAQAVVISMGGSASVDFGTLRTGDADQNDQVDIVDFSLLRASFSTLTSCALANPSQATCADFDASGQVDIVDFSLLRANFGLMGPVIQP